ncbi:MAG: histone deacetylase [Armatimonadota bacterium]|nr:histone deacetylase [Armatimonadota bacterium]MDR7519027.1 histone deacetylase [Armatimonadota bacterium]MDR7549194.1 histone deacetylase [Armatimonadota bacterium]
MSATLLVSHPACERHLTGPEHPERPERLRAIRRAVEASGLEDLVEISDVEPVEREVLEDVHTRAYIARVEALAAQGGGWFDPDTPVSRESPTAAMMAAGAACRAARSLCAGEAARAFVVVRPPGHHALPDRAMGFCLFNNAALAAVTARRAGRQRIMIVDWDVHHGNGTQTVFWRDPGVLFVSLHQEYWYPGTGAVDEMGEGPGEGFTVNVPLPPETGDGGYQDIFTEIVLPLAAAWRPDFVIVSAGYDAHYADPLGGMVLTSRGFGRLAGLLDEAARAQGAPVLAVLEGGYDLEALGASVVATLEAMTGRTAWGAPSERAPSEAPPTVIGARIRAVRSALLAHWRI